MRRIVILALATALAVSLLALPASAKGKPGFAGQSTPNVECLQAGQDTLRAAGLFSLAARGLVDYSLIDTDGPGVPADAIAPGIPAVDLDPGLIGIDLQSFVGVGADEPVFLPLSTVFKLHLDPATAPVFAWCAA